MFFKRRTTFSFLTAVLALASFILMAWCLWSPYWVIAKTRLNEDRYNTSQPLKQFYGENRHDDSDPGTFQGFVIYGLFSGCKRFNHGFGGRPEECFSIFEEHKGIYPAGLVIVVIIFIFIGLLFSLIATVFGLVNTLAVPIETIYGPVGLYLWNGLAAIPSIIALIVYLLVYFISMKSEVLSQADRDPPRNFFTEETNLGYGFFLLLAACVLLLINFIFVALAQYSADPDAFKSKKKQDPNFNSGTARRDDVGSGMIY